MNASSNLHLQLCEMGHPRKNTRRTDSQYVRQAVTRKELATAHHQCRIHNFADPQLSTHAAVPQRDEVRCALHVYASFAVRTNGRGRMYLIRTQDLADT